MATRELNKILPEPITIGQFEFSSVSHVNSESQDIHHSVKNHILLNSLEIHTEKGSIPLVVQNESKLLDSGVRIEKSDTEEAKQHFLKELEKQMRDKSISPMDSSKCPEPPRSFADLVKYRSAIEKGHEDINPRLDIHDGTTLQILDTISKLPANYRHSLLGYLKAVEEEYDKTLHKST